ncbi:Short-chain dehydrogenase/reductase fsr5 [Apiospora saccharicola]|uniref:Short-chain dehydrogenase/reductase fsr5 n=1 Tax=Apiospora saccharicola TaxID=335842 RepID=A0ABR1VM45_9PEZI
MSKYNKLAGKHVLCIGGTKGLGRGTAEASIEAGARVTIAGSSQHSADTAVNELRALYPSASIAGFGCDLSRDTVEQDLEELFNQAGGHVDHVVFTAADGLTISSLEDLTPEIIRRVSHMRQVVPLVLGKVVARRLPKTRESSLTLSTGGIADQPRTGWSLMAYVANGIVGLTRNLALDLAPVRVNAVEPGFVDTELWKDLSAQEKADMMRDIASKVPTGVAGMVEDVAEAYVYLMKDRNATGEIVKTRSGGQLV